MMGCPAAPAETIVGFDVWHVALPVVSLRKHGIGAVGGSVDIVVLRLTSESGEVGFGEASPWSVFTGSAEASYAALVRYIKPVVVGRSVADLPAIMADVGVCVAHCTEAKAAVEAALLDLQGRLVGVPVHTLLGGRSASRIPLSCSLADPDFEADLRLIERLREDGVGIVKLKAGFRDHRFDMMRLEQIRKVAPELDIRVDFNQGLHHAAAVACVRDVATFEPTFIEQPVAAHLFGLMAEIRQRIDVPLLADESVFNVPDMIRAIREGICDGVSIKIMKSGGLREAQTIARVANSVGLTAYGGDMFESGLAHLAGTHMIAATPEIGLGCEFYQARYFLMEDILSEPFPCSDGHVEVPTKPGLGLSCDVDKLGHFAVTSTIGASQ